LPAKLNAVADQSAWPPADRAGILVDSNDAALAGLHRTAQQLRDEGIDAAVRISAPSGAAASWKMPTGTRVVMSMAVRQSLLSRDASLLATAARGRAALSSMSYQTSYTLWNTFARVNRRSAASRCSGPCLAWIIRMISAPVAGKSARLRKHAMAGTVGVKSGAGLVRASSFIGFPFLPWSSGRDCVVNPRVRSLPDVHGFPLRTAIAEVVWNEALAVPTPLLAPDSMLLPKRRLGQVHVLQMCRERVADVRQRPFAGEADGGARWWTH
jgi:hypothetical protein